MIRACGIQGEHAECDNIRAQAELYQIAVDNVSPKNNEELIRVLSSGIEYDFIFLSTHGDAEGFCSEEGGVEMSWMEFGVQLCEGQCMSEDCVVMLSCCRGGLNQVAYDLFYCCLKIAYIIGPRQSLIPTDMLISFNILLYNMVHRNIDPVVSCEKLKAATDIRFVCFDRMETESDVGFLQHIKKYNAQEVYNVQHAKEKAGEQMLNKEHPYPTENIGPTKIIITK